MYGYLTFLLIELVTDAMSNYSQPYSLVAQLCETPIIPSIIICSVWGLHLWLKLTGFKVNNGGENNLFLPSQKHRGMNHNWGRLCRLNTRTMENVSLPVSSLYSDRKYIGPGVAYLILCEGSWRGQGVQSCPPFT